MSGCRQPRGPVRARPRAEVLAWQLSSRPKRLVTLRAIAGQHTAKNRMRSASIPTSRSVLTCPTRGSSRKSNPRAWPYALTRSSTATSFWDIRRQSPLYPSASKNPPWSRAGSCASPVRPRGDDGRLPAWGATGFDLLHGLSTGRPAPERTDVRGNLEPREILDQSGEWLRVDESDPPVRRGIATFVASPAGLEAEHAITQREPGNVADAIVVVRRFPDLNHDGKPT